MICIFCQRLLNNVHTILPKFNKSDLLFWSVFTLFSLYPVIGGPASSSRKNDNPPTVKSVFEYYYGSVAASASNVATPCGFYTPNEPGNFKKCNIKQPDSYNSFNICDPQNQLYYVNLRRFESVLNDTQQKHYEKECICSASGQSKPCWYKFAFAFLEKLIFPSMPLPSDITADKLCHANLSDSSQEPPIPVDGHDWDKDEVMKYGNKFAEILRQRWKADTCGEDVLILTITKGPEVLGKWDKDETPPVIFVSYGETVQSRTAHLSRPQNFQVKSMREAVDLANELLREKATSSDSNTQIEKALVVLVTWYDQLLNLADQTYERFGNRNKSHIPPTWALGAFAGCALLLVIMGIGSCLFRTRVRRGGSRGKQGGDPNRRWKAGFVGGAYGLIHQTKMEDKELLAPFNLFTRSSQHSTSTSGYSSGANL